METPSYVKPQVKSKWQAVYTRYGGGNSGLFAANTWLTNQIKTEQIIARQPDTIEKISFVIQEEQLLSRTEDGEEYVTAVLATTDVNKDGRQFDEGVLKKWADQINDGDVFSGDEDHILYDNLLDSNMSNETIKTALKQKSGIAKTIKAIYEGGKLFVRLLIDKRYRQKILNSKGLSVEAVVKQKHGNKILESDLLGFTFGITRDVQIPNTGVIA